MHTLLVCIIAALAALLVLQGVVVFRMRREARNAAHRQEQLLRDFRTILHELQAAGQDEPLRHILDELQLTADDLRRLDVRRIPIDQWPEQPADLMDPADIIDRTHVDRATA